ncbi:MAG: hypothetical protein LBT33_00155 [Spirochaetia bacterium]|jgi:hypothetical protein|nr:hypothetical protein [Spirochaetia bacterium]
MAGFPYAVVFLVALAPPFLFLVGCASQPPEAIVVSDAQDAYDALPAGLPALALLPAWAASGVPRETLAGLEEELRRQLVFGGKFRPVTMGKWLDSAFTRPRAEGPFVLLAALREERYPAPLEALCKPSVFVGGGYGILHLVFFPLAGSPYPFAVMRFFREGEDIKPLVAACLEELPLRLAAARREAETGKKRVVLEGFALEFRKLLELESGEFEFIGAPFITQQGFVVREGDDFFSFFLGYGLEASGLVRVMPGAALGDYAEGGKRDPARADYLVRGRVQLSDQMNILYAEVVEASGGGVLLGLRHPFRGTDFRSIWDACQEAARLILEGLHPPGSLVRLPPLAAAGRGFFRDGMLIGWDRLERAVLPKGMYEIRTGSPLRQGGDPWAKTFYVLLDRENLVFEDREGKYVWNLLQK